MLKHKTSCSFSGLATTRVEINSTRALPLIARRGYATEARPILLLSDVA